MNSATFQQAKTAMSEKSDEEIAEQMKREMAGGISPAQRAQAAAMVSIICTKVSLTSAISLTHES